MYLPVTHPQYQYPPSRNIYSQRIKSFSGLIHADQETETKRNQWLNDFPRPLNKLHVEVGCNAGHVVLEWAKRNPSDAYIGLDFKFKMIHKGAEKAKKRNLDNLKFLRANAERLEHIFGENEVDHLYIFFSDPWPKKAHAKHRFFKEGQFENFHKILKATGTLEIRTDHAGYFQAIEELVTTDLWEIISRTTDRHQNCIDPEKLEIPDVTLFEKIFIQDGIKICELVLKKN
jgi:tRNA (guanine-N7-)-methyltransferase